MILCGLADTILNPASIAGRVILVFYSLKNVGGSDDLIWVGVRKKKKVDIIS